VPGGSVPGGSVPAESSLPPAPVAAGALFAASLPLAQRYAELLAGPGVERGLIGPGEGLRVWDRHLLNSAVVAEFVPQGADVVDLGSGAGLPGLVLAILLPDSQVTLVEPMERRTAFLAECVAELEIGNVMICRGRAEELAGRLAADVVTSRAVARLDRLAVLAMGLVRPGGRVLAIKGAGAAQEIADARDVLRGLGVSGVEIVTAGAGLLSQPTTVVRFSASLEPPVRTPRHRGRVSRGRARPGR
jgi:16S rRNA (guanine527-N7)-methyltransferase